MRRVADKLVIEQLQHQIEKLQGNTVHSTDHKIVLGLGAMENAFPAKVFTKGAVHELISNNAEQATCTSGFISVILGKLIQNSGYCVWISHVPRRSVFPNALKTFGIDPERILFVDAAKSKDALWAIEEALKCDALIAVVGEITELSFNDSRRLQLAVEKSHVTGFIHRFKPKTENAVACVSRWKISPIASAATENPGVGFSRWHVQLLKVRNGQPDEWHVECSPNGLKYITTKQTVIHEPGERSTA
ncbi:MAG: Error-prone repair protein ImuA [Bacteroidetes bacterium]|nr:Error-prone repair protein ImuA [Bacteroidota bacterium]